VEVLATESVEKFKEAGFGGHEALLYSTLGFFAGALLTHMLDVLLTMVSLRYGRKETQATSNMKDQTGKVGIDRLSSLQHSDDSGLSLRVLESASSKPCTGDIEAFRADQITAQTSIFTDPQPDITSVSESENDLRANEAMQLSPIPNEHEPNELLRMGFLSAVVIFLHNIPEGLATFVSTIADPHAGAAVAFAVALHNIPEASQTRTAGSSRPTLCSLPLICHSIPSTPMSCLTFMLATPALMPYAT
jgi:zinc transporter ZupT